MLKFANDLASAFDALRRHAILLLFAAAVIALGLLARSWLDARDATARLQATLAAQQKTITEADQRQSTRDAQLTQTLAQIAAAKQKVQTPAQAAAALQQAIPQLIAQGPSGQPLPSPITIEIPSASQAPEPSATPRQSSAASAPANDSVARVLEPGAVPPNHSSLDLLSEMKSQLTAAQQGSLPPAIIRVPQEDLKPLYDAVEDCQACHARLTAAQADLTDERAKFAAATAQRDAAISAAHATFWKRTRTAAKWILIGAAAGAVLARYH